MEHLARTKTMRYIAITGLIIALMSFVPLASASLIGSWELDEGSGGTAYDATANNNNGTVTGATWVTDAVNGSALSFDNNNDIVNISNSASLNFGNSNVTISAWVRRNNLTTYDTIISKYYTVANQRAWLFGTDNSQGKLTFITSSNGVNSKTTSTNANVMTANKWYYVTVEKIGTVTNFYVNNVLVSDDGTAVDETIATTVSPVNIGAYEDTSDPFNGIIDVVRVRNNTLTAAERLTAYQEYHPAPQSPYYNEVVTGTYPPLTSTVNFTWIDDSTAYGANEILVSKDPNFNIIVYDSYVSVDYASLAVENGVTYYWKVKQYNSSTGVYGRTSTTQTFSVSTTSASHTTTAIEGIIYKIDNGAQVPINGATVLIYNATWSSSAIVGSNGYYLFNNLANGSTYNLYSTKTDYANSNTETVTTGNYSWTAKNILMKLSEPTWFEPNQHYVKFIVMDFFGNYKKSVAVSVYKGSEAATSFTGTTGDDGSVTFYLKKDQSYRITFVNASQSINKDMTLLPSESQYYIITSQTPTKWWDNTTYSEFGTVAVSVTTSEINSTHAFINVSYNDSLAQTSGLMVYVNQTNHTNVTRPQIIIQSSSQGTNNNVQVNFTVANYKGQSYIVNIQATHTTFASISRSFGVRFEGLASTATDFLGDKMKAVISFGFIFFVAAFFGQGSVAQGAGATAVIAWVFFGIGWLAYFDPLKIGAGITLATIVAFLAIIDERKKAEGMV